MTNQSQSEPRYRFWEFVVALGSVLLVAIIVSVSNSASVSKYFCYLIIVILLYRWLAGPKLVETLLLYALYSFLIIVCYQLQSVTRLEYYGNAGITDDALSYFYAALSWPQTEYGFYPLYGVPLDHLQGLGFLTWFPVTHPLDILLFNAVPLAMLPRFSYQLANRIQRAPTISKRAFLLVMSCPLLLSSSLALVPTGWMAMAFSGALLFLLRNEYLKLGIAIIFLFFINVGVAIVTILVLGIFGFLDFSQQRRASKKGQIIFSIFFLAALAAMVLAPNLSPQLNVNMHGLSNWVEDGLDIDYEDNTGSLFSPELDNDLIIDWIEHLHVSVRVPLQFAYFLVAPLFSPELVTANGGFLPRFALSHVLFPLLLLRYFSHFIRAVWSAWQVKNWRMQISILAYLGAIFMVSVITMPIGNKVMLLPLFYVIVAYGSYQDSDTGSLLGNAGSFGLFLIQLVAGLSDVI